MGDEHESYFNQLRLPVPGSLTSTIGPIFDNIANTIGNSDCSDSELLQHSELLPDDFEFPSNFDELDDFPELPDLQDLHENIEDLPETIVRYPYPYHHGLPPIETVSLPAPDIGNEPIVSLPVSLPPAIGNESIVVVTNKNKTKYKVRPKHTRSQDEVVGHLK